MNKTTKAKYDTAEKMLKANIPVEEIASLVELPLEDVIKFKKGLGSNTDDASANLILDYANADSEFIKLMNKKN